MILNTECKTSVKCNKYKFLFYGSVLYSIVKQRGKQGPDESICIKKGKEKDEKTVRERKKAQKGKFL